METDLVAVASRKHRMSTMTPCERRLKMAAVFLLLVVVSLCIGIAWMSRYEGGNNTPSSVCTSELCVRSAGQLMSSMDTSVNPCLDFYAFACNNWPRLHPPPDNAVSHSWFEVVNLKIRRDLHRVLESTPVARGQGSEAVRQAALFYRSCIDQAGSDSAGFGPLIELLRALGLPAQLPSNKTLDDFRLSTILGRIQVTLGMDLLLAVSVTSDQSVNSGKNLMVISPPGGKFFVSTELFTPPEMRFAHAPRTRRLKPRDHARATLDYVTDLMGVVNDAQAPWQRLDKADIRSMAAKTLIFWERISMMAHYFRNTSQRPLLLPVQVVQELFNSNKTNQHNPQINVAEFITSILGAETQFKMSADKIVLVNSQYFNAVAHLLSDTPELTVQCFLWWAVVSQMSKYTTREARRIRENLRRFEEPEYLPSSRGLYCARATHHFLPAASTHALSLWQPAHAQTSHVRRVLNDVSNALRMLVFDAGWLMPITRSSTLLKINKVSSHVGYSSKQRETKIVDNQIQGLSLDGATFLDNVVRVQSHRLMKVIRTISCQNSPPVGEDALLDTFDALVVNAFYTRDKNAIVVPAGMLQAPFLDRGLEALNYGAIGSILGHELTHGFDSEGRKFDSDGRQVSWWYEESVLAIQSREQCFVKQYSNYTLDSGAKIDGVRTLAENIADNSGLREAFLAYKMYVRREGSEPSLPGFEGYTHEQLFFLAYANIWCGIEPGPEFDRAVLLDSHCPPKIRIAGVLANFAEFSATWNCTMPDVKSACSVW